MEQDKSLLIFGTVLLSTSALLGFVQYRHRELPDDSGQQKLTPSGHQKLTHPPGH